MAVSITFSMTRQRFSYHDTDLTAAYSHHESEHLFRPLVTTPKSRSPLGGLVTFPIAGGTVHLAKSGKLRGPDTRTRQPPVFQSYLLLLGWITIYSTRGL